MENLDLVYPATSDSKSPAHSRSPKCGGRQAFQIGSDHPDGMVPPSRGFSSGMQQMAQAPNRPVRHEVQPQVTSVCVASTGLPGLCSGRTHSAMGGPGCIRLPTDCHIGQSGGEVTELPLQENHPDCSGVAQHALVLGLSDHVQSSPSQPAQPAQPIDTTFQSDPSQKSRSRASLRQWQRELRLLKEDQPDQSMRQSGPFLQSGASLIRWTSSLPL